jgi:hypothetical protein
MFGARKHQHLVPIPIINQMRKQMPLVILGNAKHLLVDPLRGGIARGHFDAHRIAQNPARQLADIIRVSSGEHQVLTLRRQELHDPPDGRNEPHVQHSIGFIEYEALHGAQIELALLGQIEQPTRRGDEQIAALVQGIDLRVDADTTKHNNRAEPDISAVGPRALGHLCGELASGSENQGAGCTAPGSTQLLQNGQHECCSFTGTRLGAGQHITAREYRGNGLCLNGGRNAVALFVYSTQQLGLQPEIGK